MSTGVSAFATAGPGCDATTDLINQSTHRIGQHGLSPIVCVP